MPVAEIAEAIGETPSATMDQIDIMRANGLVELNNDSNPEPTEEGKKENESEVFLVYKYDKRPDVSGGAIIDTTRDFCKQLIRLNRSYTLSDIKRLRNGQGLDVFTSRGGWYTKPGTNNHVPYCRHTWKQRLVKRKKK